MTKTLIYFQKGRNLGKSSHTDRHRPTIQMTFLSGRLREREKAETDKTIQTDSRDEESDKEKTEPITV